MEESAECVCHYVMMCVAYGDVYVVVCIFWDEQR